MCLTRVDEVPLHWLENLGMQCTVACIGITGRENTKIEPL